MCVVSLNRAGRFVKVAVAFSNLFAGCDVARMEISAASLRNERVSA